VLCQSSYVPLPWDDRERWSYDGGILVEFSQISRQRVIVQQKTHICLFKVGDLPTGEDLHMYSYHGLT
jgi:hypothetical protein